MDFNSLMGNSKIKEYLANVALTNQNLHSYIFAGREGIGKKIFAMNFAKMLLCLSDNKPCNNCKSCISFERWQPYRFYANRARRWEKHKD